MANEKYRQTNAAAHIVPQRRLVLYTSQVTTLKSKPGAKKRLARQLEGGLTATLAHSEIGLTGLPQTTSRNSNCNKSALSACRTISRNVLRLFSGLRARGSLGRGRSECLRSASRPALFDPRSFGTWRILVWHLFCRAGPTAMTTAWRGATSRAAVGGTEDRNPGDLVRSARS